MTRRSNRPRCYGCDSKPAKALSLPGAYGRIAMYCSLRCAAKQAVEKGLVGAVQWCDKHGWQDETGCAQCERDERGEGDE